MYKIKKNKKIKSGRLISETGSIVRKKSQAHRIEAQALSWNQKMSKMWKKAKGSALRFEPMTSGLPLRWLYIRSYKQMHKYIYYKTPPEGNFIFNLKQERPFVSHSFLNKNIKRKHESCVIFPHESNHVNH